MYDFNYKKAQGSEFNIDGVKVKESFIVDGIDGCGKSTLCKGLNSEAFKEIKHHSFIDDIPCWWNTSPDIIRKRLQFYIADNIEIINFLKNNSGYYSMKGLLSTIAIHTFFLERNYEKFLDRYSDIFQGKVKMILINCDKDTRKKRMYLRDKKTDFDLITLSNEYESYYSTVVKAFSKRVVIYTVDNSSTEIQLFSNFKKCLEGNINN